VTAHFSCIIPVIPVHELRLIHISHDPNSNSAVTQLTSAPPICLKVGHGRVSQNSAIAGGYSEFRAVFPPTCRPIRRLTPRKVHRKGIGTPCHSDTLPKMCKL